ncbi:MAG: hypothetical protein ACFCVE_04055 [Phycisphaerae bacterium]
MNVVLLATSVLFASLPVVALSAWLVLRARQACLPRSAGACNGGPAFTRSDSALLRLACGLGGLGGQVVAVSAPGPTTFTRRPQSVPIPPPGLPGVGLPAAYVRVGVRV